MPKIGDHFRLMSYTTTFVAVHFEDILEGSVPAVVGVTLDGSKKTEARLEDTSFNPEVREALEAIGSPIPDGFTPVRFRGTK